MRRNIHFHSIQLLFLWNYLIDVWCEEWVCRYKLVANCALHRRLDFGFRAWGDAVAALLAVFPIHGRGRYELLLKHLGCCGSLWRGLRSWLSRVIEADENRDAFVEMPRDLAAVVDQRCRRMEG